MIFKWFENSLTGEIQYVTGQIYPMSSITELYHSWQDIISIESIDYLKIIFQAQMKELEQQLSLAQKQREEMQQALEDAKSNANANRCTM